MTMNTLKRDDDGTYPAVAFPGEYEIHYITADCGTLCAKCANSDGCRDCQADCPDDDQWRIVGAAIHLEGPDRSCYNCNATIESEYGDPDVPETKGTTDAS